LNFFIEEKVRVYLILYKLILLVAFGLGLVDGFNLKAEAIGEGTIIVKDLSGDFIHYDHSSESYLPHLGQEVLNTNKSLTIPVSAYRDYQLIFKAQPGLSVFQNYKLIYENTGDQVEYVFLPLTELVSGNSFDMFSFYQKDGLLPETVKIGYMGNLSENHDQVLIQKRAGILLNEVPFFMLMFVLTLGVFIKQRCTKEIAWIMHSEKMGYGHMEELVASVNYFQWPFMLIVLLNSLGLAYSVSLLDEGVSGEIKSFEFFFIWTIVIFLLYYLKYIFFEIMARIFNIGSIAKIHFREVIRISLGFNMIIVPVICLSYSSTLIEWRISYIGFLTILMLALLFGLLRLLVLTFRVPQFNYLYLFSYLCMAEIIPLAFVIKITLLSGLSL